jgi:cytoskeletal protein RodZ
MWRPDLSEFKRTRRSTWILLLLFAGVFVLYLWVRPAPTTAPSQNTGNQHATQRTTAPSRPRTHSPTPSHSKRATQPATTTAPSPTRSRTTPASTAHTSHGSTVTTPAPTPDAGTTLTGSPSPTNSVSTSP